MMQQSSLRHRAFFERLGAMREADKEWPAVSAGLVVLRSLDARLLDGVEPDNWRALAAREAVEAIPAHHPVRTSLARLLDLADGDAPPEPTAIGPHLMAYAQSLEFNAEWGLASDVYLCLTEIMPADSDAELVMDAYMRLGYTARMRTEWEVATTALDRAARIAAAHGDAPRLLRVRMANAHVALDRGNLPLAEDILAETVALSASLDGAVHAEALQGRGLVAVHRREYPTAISFFHQALVRTTNQVARDRILLDLGAASMDMGARTVARDALLILAVTAQARNTRWIAVVNLLELAVLERNELAFEQYRRELGGETLSPRLAAAFAFYEGQGHAAFGRLELARGAYDRACAIAREHSLNKYLFDAEDALAALARVPLHSPAPAIEVTLPDFLRGVAEDIRHRREEAYSGT